MQDTVNATPLLPSETEKAVRLVEYLLRLASLRTKVIRDIADYEVVLWINDIPHQKGCFAQAWGADEEYNSDVWVEIQNQREPELPSVPDRCKDWLPPIDVLLNKNDLPELLPEITVQIRNPAWQEGTELPEFINRPEQLGNYPEIQNAWDNYVEERWMPWADKHNEWESVHRAYSILFAIHQEQLRLGEEYELVLGLGLLTWLTPTGQRVRRHLIAANAMIEFEARLGRFAVLPNPDGASVRPELDMLTIEEQPTKAEETAKETLIDAADDPWMKGCIEDVLKTLVHSINPQGEYYERLGTESLRASTAKPIVEYAPAIILRKRSVKGLTETLRRIKGRIEKGEEIPSEFADLAEIRRPSNSIDNDDLSSSDGIFDGDIFFPKPSNDEQRRIVDKLRTASGVLVQGPPGTGKSHTIANLICHLLATGQRILVTAKTPRALQVLMGRFNREQSDRGKQDEGLIPEEIRPLCISLLGSGLEEKLSLESSVGGILRKYQEWDSERATADLGRLEQSLRRLREEKVKIDRRLSDIRESETHSQIVAQGSYQGTAARIAQSVRDRENEFHWFTDVIPHDKSCPVSENELLNVIAILRNLTPEKRRELELQSPDDVPPPERFFDLVNNEKSWATEERDASQEADPKMVDLFARSEDSAIQDFEKALSDFVRKRREVLAFPFAWINDAVRDITSNTTSLWAELYRVTLDLVTGITEFIMLADDTEIEIPQTTNVALLFEDTRELIDHLDGGGRLGWGPFRPKLVKERLYVLKSVRVNGHTCSDGSQLSTLADILHVRVEFEKVWKYWGNRCENITGPFAMQLRVLDDYCNVLQMALALEDALQLCRSTLQECGGVPEPTWSDESQVQSAVASCKVALARQAKHRATYNIHQLETPLAALISTRVTHPLTQELLESINGRDIAGYTCAFAKICDLDSDRKSLQKVTEYIRSLRHVAPNLTENIEQTYREAYWEVRIGQIPDAWHWAQARTWLHEYIRKEDAPSLDKRVKQIADEIGATIAGIASVRAWSFCFSRLKEDHRRHMEAWCKHMNALTKSGKGKRDYRNRRAAQKSLNECREAVPAWVMPLHRVWDTIDPAPGMFDIIIVDEASQCDFEALPLHYLGKKILVVGDDKQISPGGEFQEAAPINALKDQYLGDFQFSEYFDVNVSLFDHAKLRYGRNSIVLREHFRCMPEIIRFSNDLCYSTTPLIPLRQYGPNRLPPVEHKFVEGGYREGSNNRTINRPEADAIVAKIVELCKDRRYHNKTMGVIALQGEAQASLIESMLLERIGGHEMDTRRLLCGNPYSFQGDERHIMFLSMVTGPDAVSGLVREGPTDEKRYNVAASRARDQMWLFHSVKCEDLSQAYLRKRLLGFFEGNKQQEIGSLNREGLERRAFQDNREKVKAPLPFESWFEVDVALELSRRDFYVIPQFPVAGKKIDIVVEGGHARLAVECDGDKWHGVEQYEADMERQRKLERCGWEFFRVRESAFKWNRENALSGLWRLLEERDIFPGPLTCHSRHEEDESEVKSDQISVDDSEADEEEMAEELSLFEDSSTADGLLRRRPDDIPASEIQNAIIVSLRKCPNHTCTLQSLTSRVLRELGVLTRGNPRLEFEKRVIRSLGILENREITERYRAKNKRVRLLES